MGIDGAMKDVIGLKKNHLKCEMKNEMSVEYKSFVTVGIASFEDLFGFEKMKYKTV